jgi:hypothetical protein
VGPRRARGAKPAHHPRAALGAVEVPLHRILAIWRLLTPEERAARAVRATAAALPFATWEYRPPYLPPVTRIDVATGTAASEPLVFATPFGGRPDAFPEECCQPLIHPKGVVEITGLRITLPRGEPTSDVVRALHQAGVVSFETGNDHQAEIEFDHDSQGQSADFRPLLPLRFRW